MATDWRDLFVRGRKPLIGMVHLEALPGSPRFDHRAGVSAIVDAAAADVQALVAAGFDAVLFVNEADAPFPEAAPLDSAASLAAVVAGSAPPNLPFGVEFLFDPLASLACAIATDAAFIRGGVIGSWETTSGWRQGRAAEVLRARAAARAERIGIFSVPVAEFAFPVAPTTLAARISTANAEHAMDALLLGGAAPGIGVDDGTVREARTALREPIPVLANSGVRSSNVARILETFDGCFVGSDVKCGGDIRNRVDRQRADAFVAAARAPAAKSS